MGCSGGGSEVKAEVVETEPGDAPVAQKGQVELCIIIII